MKYVDEFRDPNLARQLVDQIRAAASKRWVLMEVCGGQTHSLLRNGIEEVLHDSVELIHGPGCPVCVTPAESIDFAQTLAMRQNTTLVSFGDMLRVPGSIRSLQETRASGGDVVSVYSPSDAVQLARQSPEREFVFFAVGFETTAPATALAVLQAQRLGLKNFRVLGSHVRVLPAMEAIMNAPENRVQGFLAAGHVCTVTGYRLYETFAKRHRIPVVVTGFEPIDLLCGILEAITQLESGVTSVKNKYGRSVTRDGNQLAMRTIDTVYEVTDKLWRGFGVIPEGGWKLRPSYQSFDADGLSTSRDGLPVIDESNGGTDDRSSCQSGEVLSGRIKPTQCVMFGSECRPDRPLGAPMVSSEGACAAYYRYRATAQTGEPIHE